MLAHEEAAAILIRVLEALARSNGKTLNPRTRADVGRACELLATCGDELDDLLDTIPPAQQTEPRPAREYAAVPAEVERWRRERPQREQ